MTWTWSHWCCSKFYFCNSLTAMLYLPSTKRWTGSCVIQFLPEGRSKTMLHHWCGSGKYTTVLCSGTGGGDGRVPAPFHNWGVEGCWNVLWCAESLRDWGVFFILVQVRLRDVKKIPWQCNSLTLELVGWSLSIKRHETYSKFQKSWFSLSGNLHIYI